MSGCKLRPLTLGGLLARALWTYMCDKLRSRLQGSCTFDIYLKYWLSASGPLSFDLWLWGGLFVRALWAYVWKMTLPPAWECRFSNVLINSVVGLGASELPPLTLGALGAGSLGIHFWKVTLTSAWEWHVSDVFIIWVVGLGTSELRLLTLGVFLLLALWAFEMNEWMNEWMNEIMNELINEVLN